MLDLTTKVGCICIGGQGSLVIPLVGAIHVGRVLSVKYPVANDRYSRWDERDQGEEKVGCSWC